MHVWRQVIKVVTPKRAALAEAEAAFEVVMVGLRAKQYELQVWFTETCAVSLRPVHGSLRQSLANLLRCACGWHALRLNQICHCTLRHTVHEW